MDRNNYYGGQNNSLQNNGYSVDEFYGQSGGSQSGTYGQNSGYSQSGTYGQNGGYSQSGTYGQNGGYSQSGTYGQNSGYSQSGTYSQNNGYSQSGTYGQNNSYSQNDTYGQSSTDYPSGGSSHIQSSTRSKSALEKLDDKLPIISVIGKIAIFGYYLFGTAVEVLKMVQQRGGFDLNLIYAVLPNFMAMMVMYMGWAMLVDYKKKLVKQKGKCTDPVMATLVDYKVVVNNSGDGETTNMYYAVYNYTYNDVTYRTKSDIEYVFSNNEDKSDKNFECKLLVNPKNPMEIYEVDQEFIRSKQYRIVGIVAFVFFTIVALSIKTFVFK